MSNKIDFVSAVTAVYGRLDARRTEYWDEIIITSLRFTDGDVLRVVEAIQSFTCLDNNHILIANNCALADKHLYLTHVSFLRRIGNTIQYYRDSFLGIQPWER